MSWGRGNKQRGNMSTIIDTVRTLNELETALKDIKKMMNDDNLQELTQGILSEIYLHLINTIRKRKQQLEEDNYKKEWEEARYT